jgi:hypothetical protein
MLSFCISLSVSLLLLLLNLVFVEFSVVLNSHKLLFPLLKDFLLSILYLTLLLLSQSSRFPYESRLLGLFSSGFGVPVEASFLSAPAKIDDLPGLLLCVAGLPPRLLLLKAKQPNAVRKKNCILLSSLSCIVRIEQWKMTVQAIGHAWPQVTDRG